MDNNIKCHLLQITIILVAYHKDQQINLSVTNNQINFLPLRIKMIHNLYPI